MRERERVASKADEAPVESQAPSSAAVERATPASRPRLPAGVWAGLAGGLAILAAVSLLSGRAPQPVGLEVRPSAVLPAGDLNLRSSPSEAAVYLDGVLVGSTPLVLRGVREGTTVQLRKDGFWPTTVAFDTHVSDRTLSLSTVDGTKAVAREMVERHSEYREAIPILEGLLEKHPDDPELHYLLAWAYGSTGRGDLEVWHYEELLHLDRESALAAGVADSLRARYRQAGTSPRHPADFTGAR